MYSRNFSDKDRDRIILPAHYGGTFFREREERPARRPDGESTSQERELQGGGNAPADRKAEAESEIESKLGSKAEIPTNPPWEDDAPQKDESHGREETTAKAAGLNLAAFGQPAQKERPDGRDRSLGEDAGCRKTCHVLSREKSAPVRSGLLSDPEELLLAALAFLLFGCEKHDDLLACILLYLLFVK